MNVFAKFDEIPSMILQDIKETKHYRHTFVRSFRQTDGRENSIPSHKHSLRGGIIMLDVSVLHDVKQCIQKAYKLTFDTMANLEIEYKIWNQIPEI